MTRPGKHKSVLATTLTLFLAAALPLTVHAEGGFGISNNPDTQTRFVWLGAESRENPGAARMLLLQNGNRKYETSLMPAVNIHFAKNDVGRIKWCSYAVTARESSKALTKCLPDTPLIPDGEIRLP